MAETHTITIPEDYALLALQRLCMEAGVQEAFLKEVVDICAASPYPTGSRMSPSAGAAGPWWGSDHRGGRRGHLEGAARAPSAARLSADYLHDSVVRGAVRARARGGDAPSGAAVAAAKAASTPRRCGASRQ